MKIKLLITAIVITLLSGCFLNSNDTFAGLDEIESQISAVDCDDHDRASEVKDLFVKSGASEHDVLFEEFEGGRNVVLTLNGKSDETVILGAHYDKTNSGCGAIDNWTGIVIITNIYRDLRTKNNEKTYKFVAFDKEEIGLVGSKAVAEKIPENERANYCAMVNFDSFGFSETWALEDVSDGKLIDLARAVAKGRNASFSTKEFKGASADSKSFREIGIPAITLSGLGDNWRKYLHQREDQVENINFAKVFENLKFSVQFVKAIDSTECDSFR